MNNNNKEFVMYEQVVYNARFDKICELCHLANNELMIANNETPCGNWDTLDSHLKQMTRDSVSVIIDKPNITAEDIHNTWMTNKAKDGWVYGDIKDANKKTHPLMIPFADMNAIDKAKDQSFIDIVNANRDLL